MKKTVLLLLTLCCVYSCSDEQSSETKTYQLYEKACSYLSAKQYTSARPLLEEVSTAFTQFGKDEYAVEALTRLAYLEYEICEFRSALRRIASAKSIAHRDANVRSEIQLLLLEGELYRVLRNTSKSYQLFSSARSLASAFGDKEAELEAAYRQLSLALSSSSPVVTFEDFQSLLMEAQKENAVEKCIKILIALGELLRKNGKYIEAGNYLTQARILAEKHDARILEIQCLRGLAHLYSSMEKYREAVDHFSRALTKAQDLHDNRKYEILLLFEVGQLNERFNKLQDAKVAYTAALEKARLSGDRLSENYLSLFLVQCTYKLFTPQQRDAQVNKLVQSYEQLAKRFRSCGHVTGEAALYIEIGKIFERKGNLDDANTYYKRALECTMNSFCDYYSPEWHLPYLKALGIDGDHSSWYTRAAHVLVQLKRYEEAWSLVEHMHQRRYFDQCLSLDIPLRHVQVKERVSAVRDMIQQACIVEYEIGARLSNGTGQTASLDKMNALLDSLRTSIRSLSHDIASKYRNVETFVFPAVPLLSVSQRSIARGVTVLEYCVSDEATDIFVITPSALSVKTVPIRKDSLQALLSIYIQLMNDPLVYAGEGGEASLPSMTRYALLSAELYDLLLRPVEQYWSHGILIVPDPVFEGFPFHALERQEKKTVQYCIERVNVDYLPMLSSVLYATKPLLRVQTIVAFGNPTGKNWAIDYELRDIRSFLPSAKIFIGLEVSWTTVRTTKADVLQLAMGIQRPSPHYPVGAVMVSDGLTLGGVSTVPFEKVLEMEASPLVLLTNQQEYGGALAPLHTHLLRSNGVSDVICNLWSADRKAAKFFSEFFYSFLSQGLAPGDAYRQALLKMIRIREINHQRSWAQYFHYGIG
ncbi:MAG: CHAT domain-containing protein [Bacteroidetes bacterium]|nr:CHAT domain-containing protein [Bacteroidota bacterium]